MSGEHKNVGFTIVELLIVIVIIAILAAIVSVTYIGLQDRARQTKITSDLASLSKAVLAAQTVSGKTLKAITGSGGTFYPCSLKPTGTNLATLSKQTDACWTLYNTSLNLISNASGVNVRNIVDPWGRPYYIDENEDEYPADVCRNDEMAMYTQPYVKGPRSNGIVLPFTLAECG